MHFTVEAQRMIREHYSQMDERFPLIAIDATAGNGHDTAFLAELVGESGVVLAIDIQSRAIESAKEKIERLGFTARVHWYCGCHSQLSTVLAGQGIDQIDVAMFNLGYLPGCDRSIATQPHTTLAALETTWQRLKSNSLLSIISYPGHSGGNSEHQRVESWVADLAQSFADTDGRIQNYREPGDPRSPEFWLIEKS